MGAIAVYIFFFISGFLILQSYETNSKIKFIKARFLRIYPAYFILILFTVFVIAIVADYHHLPRNIFDLTRFTYFAKLNPFNTNGNIVGLFQQNYLSNQINNSLWTIPFEIFCYLILFILGCLGIFKYKHSTLLLWLLLILIQKYNLFNFVSLTIPIFNLSCYTFIDFLIFFITGMLFYIYKNSIHLNFVLLIGIWLILYLLKSTEYFEMFRYLLVGYIIYFIAMYKEFSWYNSNMKNDYSYGIYLYAFPIQQLFCTLYLEKVVSLSFSIIISFLITLLLAILSWHFLEKPCLKLK